MKENSIFGDIMKQRIDSDIKRTKITDLSEGPIALPLIRFAIPLLFGSLLQQTYSITDSIIVGNFLGASGLAAIGASSPIINLSIAVAIGITLGVSISAAQHFGAKETEALKTTIWTSYVFFLLLSLAISFAGAIFSRSLLKLIRTPKENLADAARYLRITFLGTPFVLGYNVTSSLFRGIGDSKTPLKLLAISTCMNVILDIVFIIVFNTGIWGAALATCISQCIIFIVAVMVFFLKNRELVPVHDARSFNTKELSKFLSIGIPSGIKGSMYWGGFVLLTSLINSFGSDTIAAFSIASRIDSVVQTPMISLQHALGTFVGQNVGAKKTDRISRGVNTASILGTALAICMTIVVYFGCPIFLSLFSRSEAIVNIGTQYLRTVSLFYIVYALQETTQGVAIGCGDTWILMISTIVAMWGLRIPLAYTLSSRLGSEGIWLSIPSGWFIAAIFAWGYYLSKYWKRRIDGSK